MDARYTLVFVGDHGTCTLDGSAKGMIDHLNGIGVDDVEIFGAKIWMATSEIGKYWHFTLDGKNATLFRTG